MPQDTNVPTPSAPVRQPLPPLKGVTPAPNAPPSAQQIADEPPPKIQVFEQRLGQTKRHEDTWNRSPNTPGTGAIHVKTFHCKLNNESLEWIDQQINEWLDAHPQYEVKLVTNTVGDWTGKMGKEPNLIVQVWV